MCERVAGAGKRARVRDAKAHPGGGRPRWNVAVCEPHGSSWVDASSPRSIVTAFPELVETFMAMSYVLHIGRRPGLLAIGQSSLACHQSPAPSDP